MAAKYQDYYETLGVDRKATPAQIKRAYRKLARQYHPDLNADKGAEERFKQINEAHEVLGDPEKRKRYDQLGEDWKAGQDFRPPPGWEDVHFEYRTASPGESFHFGAGFSDFFETLFGGRGPVDSKGTRRPSWAMRGADHEAKIDISLQDAYHGVTKTMTLQGHEADERGGFRPFVRNTQVRIPAGVTDGKRIRLAGKGGPGVGGGPPGDLYLKVHIEPDPRFRVLGHDLEFDVPVAVWEAALGASAEVPLVEGKVGLKIPPGTQSGQRLRLREKGLPKRGGGRGDLYAVVKIMVPKAPSAKERELFEEMARVSSFNPRKDT
jgi:curved DNA-binding protein